MSKTAISLSKFAGSISLGLSTGVSYALATFSIPALLALPSSRTAHHSFTQLRTSGVRHLQALAAVSSASLLLAYTLSSRQGRHPYLLWTASTAVLAIGWDVIFDIEQKGLVLFRSHSSRRANREPEDPANGEEVRASMEKFQQGQLVKASIAGLGFVMSVVGLWGDGY